MQGKMLCTASLSFGTKKNVTDRQADQGRHQDSSYKRTSQLNIDELHSWLQFTHSNISSNDEDINPVITQLEPDTFGKMRTEEGK